MSYCRDVSNILFAMFEKALPLAPPPDVVCHPPLTDVWSVSAKPTTRVVTVAAEDVDDDTDAGTLACFCSLVDRPFDIYVLFQVPRKQQLLLRPCPLLCLLHPRRRPHKLSTRC